MIPEKGGPVMKSVVQPELLSERDAAQFLGVSAVFLRKRRRDGGGPAFVRIGSRNIRYRVGDLQAWIDARLVEV